MSLASPSPNRTNTPSELSLASLSSLASSSSTQTASSTAASTITASSEWTEGVQNEQSLQISEFAHSSEDGSLANSAIIKMDAEVELPEAAAVQAQAAAETKEPSSEVRSHILAYVLVGIGSVLTIAGPIVQAIMNDGSQSAANDKQREIALSVLSGTGLASLVSGLVVGLVQSKMEASTSNQALA